jgi:hypothetical protein
MYLQLPFISQFPLNGYGIATPGELATQFSECFAGFASLFFARTALQ